MLPVALSRPCMNKELRSTSPRSAAAASSALMLSVASPPSPPGITWTTASALDLGTARSSLGSLARFARELAHAGEEVVLGRLCGHERAGEHVVVVGVHGAGDLGRQAEPE